MVKPKTKEEIKIMREGGKKLAQIRERLKEKVRPGVEVLEIDKLAEELIGQAGGKPSFKMVPGYSWATCINLNEGVVHGVPKDIVLQEGDLVSVDVGMFYKGFHTDTSFTVGVGNIGEEKEKFLKAGREALSRAIKEAKPENRIGHISRAMQGVLEKRGYSPVRSLTGHGIGKNLHEEPQIPCFWEGLPEESPQIPEGATLAIEAIYTMGSPKLVLSNEDSWTIRTRDGKMAAVFEETVAATARGPLILTK